jgi:hypothetical protein
MYQTSQPFFLLPRHTRMINASEGLRLQVLEGCLWLTRPGDESDRFLHAGSSIELHEDLVLIESDWDPAHTSVPAARYRLEPLTQAQSSTPVARSALLRLLAWMPLRPLYP